MKKLLFFIAAIFVFTNSYSQNEKKPKYIFLFIGDGMGMVQTQLADAYLRATENDSLNFMYFHSFSLHYLIKFFLHLHNVSIAKIDIF